MEIRSLFVLASVIALVVAIAGCSSSGAAAEVVQQRPPAKPSPLEGKRFYIDPESRAADAVVTLEIEGVIEDADLLRQEIANQPLARWFGGKTRTVEQKVRRYVKPAHKAGTTPLLVAYNIPLRDCGLYSQGGAKSAQEYRAWIDRFAAGIGKGPAVVILEPDAVAHSLNSCLAEEGVAQRYGLLQYAVRRLKALPATFVYLDGGNASWVEPMEMAAALKEAGVIKADGFALNVSNFGTTADSVAYGDAMSRRLKGLHFVIDTSRNGNGPYKPADSISWCNPPGRSLGKPPTAKTGKPRLDALLWVKNPGESDGTCRGGPDAGQWWMEYALKLIRQR